MDTDDIHGSRRWERLDWLVLIGYLVLAHLIFYPALRPGVFLYGRDTVFHDFGLLLYNWSLIVDEGRLGLWNPYLFCGLPALGTFTSCPFYPLTWLFVVLPAAWAFTYQYVLNDWLAGLWTYWAARRMGLRRIGALFAGLVFMGCGHVVTLAHAGHLQKFAAIAWVPLAFGCATAAMKERRWRFWIGCGVAMAAQLLASHIQIAYYTVLFLLPWALWLAVGQPTGKRIAAARFGIGGIALALLVAGGLSAAQMLPAIETTPLTNRGPGMAFKDVADTSYPPLEFIEYLLPSFLGDSASGPQAYWGEWGERIVTDYMGLLPVALLLFALAAGRRRDHWFWLAVILVTGILAAGRFTPVFRLAFDWLPGLNRFRSPGTIMVFIAWPAAILAAQGFEEFTDRVVRDEKLRWHYSLNCIVIAVVFAVLHLAFVTSVNEWPFVGRAGRSLVFDNPRGVALWVSLQRSFLFAALSCGALAAVAICARFVGRGKGGKLVYTLACGTVFVLAFMDPHLHESRYIKAAALQPFREYLSHHWADSIVQKLPRPVRGIETGNEYSNRMMTRGIGSLHGYHPVYLQAYQDLLDLYSQNHAQLGQMVFEQFTLAPKGQSPGREYEMSDSDGGQVLWLRRPPPLYAYFPQEIQVVSDRRALLEAMAQPDFDPYRRSYTLDPALAYRAKSNQGQDTGATSEESSATARVIRYSANRMDLEVTCDEERPMVVAELAAPGWSWLVARASLPVNLDAGEELASAVVNHAFRATRVPAGVCHVTLIYRPFSFRLGLYLTLLFLLGLVVVVLTNTRCATNKRRKARG